MTKDETQIERPLSAKQAGDILGINAKTVIRMAESGELPVYRVGKLLKFKRSEVEAYFESRRILPGHHEDAA